LLVLANVPFAIIGGIMALHLTGMNFGISAGVGFIALAGNLHSEWRYSNIRISSQSES
jgi:Cu/Ag efflux pump CusA